MRLFVSEGLPDSSARSWTEVLEKIFTYLKSKDEINLFDTAHLISERVSSRLFEDNDGDTFRVFVNSAVSYFSSLKNEQHRKIALAIILSIRELIAANVYIYLHAIDQKSLCKFLRICLNSSDASVLTQTGQLFVGISCIPIQMINEVCVSEFRRILDDLMNQSTSISRRHGILFILKALISGSPTFFYNQINHFMDRMLILLHDPDSGIRESAVAAIGLTWPLIEERSELSNFTQHLYQKITFVCFHSASKHAIHGSLLLLGELLRCKHIVSDQIDEICVILKEYVADPKQVWMIKHAVLTLVPYVASIDPDKFVLKHLPEFLTHIINIIVFGHPKSKLSNAVLALAEIALALSSNKDHSNILLPCMFVIGKIIQDSLIKPSSQAKKNCLTSSKNNKDIQTKKKSSEEKLVEALTSEDNRVIESCNILEPLHLSSNIKISNQTLNKPSKNGRVRHRCRASIEKESLDKGLFEYSADLALSRENTCISGSNAEKPANSDYDFRTCTICVRHMSFVHQLNTFIRHSPMRAEMEEIYQLLPKLLSNKPPKQIPFDVEDVLKCVSILVKILGFKFLRVVCMHALLDQIFELQLSLQQIETLKTCIECIPFLAEGIYSRLTRKLSNILIEGYSLSELDCENSIKKSKKNFKIRRQNNLCNYEAGSRRHDLNSQETERTSQGTREESCPPKTIWHHYYPNKFPSKKFGKSCQKIDKIVRKNTSFRVCSCLIFIEDCLLVAISIHRLVYIFRHNKPINRRWPISRSGTPGLVKFPNLSASLQPKEWHQPIKSTFKKLNFHNSNDHFSSSVHLFSQFSNELSIFEPLVQKNSLLVDHNGVDEQVSNTVVLALRIFKSLNLINYITRPDLFVNGVLMKYLAKEDAATKRGSTILILDLLIRIHMTNNNQYEGDESPYSEIGQTADELSPISSSSDTETADEWPKLKERAFSLSVAGEMEKSAELESQLENQLHWGRYRSLFMCYESCRPPYFCSKSTCQDEDFTFAWLLSLASYPIPLISPSLSSIKHYRMCSDIIERLLIAANLDVSSIIQRTVVNYLPFCLNIFLFKQENLKKLLIFFYSEDLETCQIFLSLICRLVLDKNTEISSFMAQLFTQLMSQLQYARDMESQMRSTRLLAIFIHNAQNFVSPYINSILQLLMDKLKAVKQGTRLHLLLLSAIGELAFASREILTFRQLQTLIPSIYQYLKSSMSKWLTKRLALQVLVQLAQVTSHQVNYLAIWPELFSALLDMAKMETNDVVRPLLITAIGALGTLIPRTQYIMPYLRAMNGQRLGGRLLNDEEDRLDLGEKSSQECICPVDHGLARQKKNDHAHRGRGHGRANKPKDLYGVVRYEQDIKNLEAVHHDGKTHIRAHINARGEKDQKRRKKNSSNESATDKSVEKKLNSSSKISEYLVYNRINFYCNFSAISALIRVLSNLPSNSYDEKISYFKTLVSILQECVLPAEVCPFVPLATSAFLDIFTSDTDPNRRIIMVSQLGHIIALARGHHSLTSCLLHVFRVLVEIWDFNLSRHLLLLIERSSSTLGEEFKIYLPILLPKLLELLNSDASNVSTFVLHTFSSIRSNLQEYLHLIIPEIMNLIVQNKFEEQSIAGIRAVGKLCYFLDSIEWISKIMKLVIQMLQKKCSRALTVALLDTVCHLLARFKYDALIFTSELDAVLARQSIVHATYKSTLSKLFRREDILEEDLPNLSEDENEQLQVRAGEALSEAEQRGHLLGLLIKKKGRRAESRLKPSAERSPGLARKGIVSDERVQDLNEAGQEDKNQCNSNTEQSYFCHQSSCYAHSDYKFRCGETWNLNVVPNFASLFEEGAKLNSPLLAGYTLDEAKLMKAWSTAYRVTHEDWVDWMQKLSIEFIRQSPCLSIRYCLNHAQTHPFLTDYLFTAAFVSCYIALQPPTIDDLAKNLRFSFKSQNLPLEHFGTWLNLAAFLKKKQAPFPIEDAELAELAIKFHNYAEALTYKEFQFQTNQSAEIVEDIITLMIRLRIPDGSEGMLSYSRKHLKLEEKVEWYEKLNHWKKAFKKYRFNFLKKFLERVLTIPSAELINSPRSSLLLCKFNRPRSRIYRRSFFRPEHRITPVSKLVLDRIAVWPRDRMFEPTLAACNTCLFENAEFCPDLLGKIRCLHALGDWDIILKYCRSVPSHHPEISAVAPIAASAAWCIQDWPSFSFYLQMVRQVDVQSIILHAAMQIHNAKTYLDMEVVRAVLEKGRNLIDTEMVRKLMGGNQDAYDVAVNIQLLNELEDVISYKTYPYKRKCIRQVWNARLKLLPYNFDLWNRILTIRALAEVDEHAWLKYATLCEESGNRMHARWILCMLLGRDPFKEAGFYREQEKHNPFSIPLSLVGAIESDAPFGKPKSSRRLRMSQDRRVQRLFKLMLYDMPFVTYQYVIHQYNNGFKRLAYQCMVHLRDRLNEDSSQKLSHEESIPPEANQGDDEVIRQHLHEDTENSCEIHLKAEINRSNDAFNCQSGGCSTKFNNSAQNMSGCTLNSVLGSSTFSSFTDVEKGDLRQSPRSSPAKCLPRFVIPYKMSAYPSYVGYASPLCLLHSDNYAKSQPPLCEGYIEPSCPLINSFRPPFKLQKLKARCSLMLGKWYYKNHKSSLNIRHIEKVIEHFLDSLMHFPDWKTGWKVWANFNLEIVQSYERKIIDEYTKLKEKNYCLDEFMNALQSCKKPDSYFSFHYKKLQKLKSTLYDVYLSDEKPQDSGHFVPDKAFDVDSTSPDSTSRSKDSSVPRYEMLNTTFVSKVNISYAHAISSVLGFLRSFALDKDSFYLEDVVRLLTLWFKYGSSAEIEDIMRHSLESVHVDIWLPVVSLIIARIDFKILSVRRIILKLSLQLCRVHPQVLAFQIALAEKSQATQNRSMIEILKNQMRQEQDTQIERQIKKRARLMKDREKEIEDGTLEFSLCDQMGTWKTGSALDGRSEPRPNRGENQLKGKALSTERLASVQVFLDESKPGEGGLEVKRSHFDPEEPVNSYACYENLKHHSLLDEVSFLSEELIKMTIIGYEACYLALEKACWFYGCRNIKKMLQVLDSYYAGLACPAVTTIERGFRQQYAGILNKAWKECELYRKSQNENHITQAASLYTKVYNSISLQLKNLKNLNLSDVSPRLLETSSFNLAVPATYQAHQPIVTIERFCRAIKIIPSKRRPRKLKIKGSNGHVYNYLLKGHEDLRHDERIMQFLGQINQTLIRSRSKVRRREERRTYAMDASDVERLRETLRCGYSANGWFPPLSGTGSSDPERRSGLEEQSGGHGGQSVSAESRISYSCAAPTNRYFDGPLPVQTYKVVPLSPCVGLIGWVPHSDTLKQLIKEYRLHYAQNFTLDFEIEFLSNKTSNYSLLTKIQKLELFEEVLKKSDGKDLANLMWLKSSSSQIWLNRRIRYTKSLAVMSMVGYLLGLGDRHSDNIMINRYSGGVIHIDFGDCLEASALCKEPEKVQFRLTRMLVNAMGATGTDGIFESTCVHVLRILRENKNNLMTVLRAFLYDPLMNWILPKREKKLASDGECEGQTVEKSCQYKKCQERCHIDQEETDSENKNLSFSLARQGSLQVLNCSMFSALSQRDNLDRNNNSNNILPSEAPSDAPSDAEAPRPSLGRLAHLNSLYSSAPPLLRSSFEHIAPSDPVPDYSSTVYQQPPNLSQDHLGHTSLYSTSHSQLHHHYSLSQMQYDYISKSDQFYSLSNDYSSARSCPDKQDTFTLAESAADPYRLQEGYGERSLLAIHRVYEKLVGKDFADSSGVRPPGKKQATSVSFTFQVNQLIEQATSHENLCQCFPGWSPWW